MTHFLSLNRAVLVATLLLFGVASALHAQTIKTFDAPNSSYTVPRAINSIGQITGYYQDATGFHGFVRQRDDTITTFDVLLGGNLWPAFATDIALSGEITGYVPHSITTLGFVRQANGTIETFAVTHSTPYVAATEPAPRLDCPVDGTAAIAINAVGQITGSYQLPGVFCSGFLRQRDGTITLINVQPQSDNVIPMTFPQAINLWGQITGYYHDVNGYRGFLRQPNGTIIRFDPPSSTSTTPQAINLLGQITGYYQDATFLIHGFLRQPNGTVITFDPTGSISTQATAINLAGQITGFYATADGIYHGFLRRRNGNIETFDIPGAGNGGTFPKDINDFGQIVGYYQDANFALHGFVRNAR
jgi:uncharacterized membrane protein